MNDTSIPQKSRKGRNSTQTTALSAGRALAEALSIAREAEARANDTDSEIDWTRDPLNDHEAKLRAVIIRRVETEARLVIERGYEAGRQLRARRGETSTEAELANEASSVAQCVAGELESLVIDQLKIEDRYDYDSDYTIGSDLMDRIEHWEAIVKESDLRARRLERDRLLRHAKLDT